MKTIRGIFLSALLMCVSMLSFSQYVVTIGDVANNTSNFPLNSNYNYSLSQQIYTASELSVSSGDIVSISFYSTGNNPTRNIDVYLESTDLSVFSGNLTFVPLTSTTPVFSGSVEFVNGGWTTITFTEPYHYEGGNLLLTIDDNTGSYVSPMYVATYNCEGVAALSLYTDSEDLTLENIGTYSPGNYEQKNTIRITFENAADIVIGSYPWTEDFESGAIGTSGMTQQIVSGSAEWQIASEDTTHEGNYLKISNLSSNLTDTTILYTPTFSRPDNASMMILSFDYVNRAWDDDFDMMSVVYEDEDGMSVLATYDTNNEEWQTVNIMLDIADLASEFRIGFIGVPNYGYGFLIDNIVMQKYPVNIISTDSYVQIGTGTLSHNLPVYTYYEYGYSQQIYNNIEMTGIDTIYYVSFYCTSTINVTRNIKVYMGHTEAESFETSESWIPASQLTEVYSGDFEIINGSNWIMLTLDTPFEYNGTDNVVLAVDDNSGSWVSGVSFTATEVSANMAINVCQDGEDYVIDALDGVSGSTMNLRNNVRFGIKVPEFFALDVSSSDTVMGEVCCSGEYLAGSVVTISATPNYGFVFDSWSDGSDENPRSIIIDADMQYIASFKQQDTDTLDYSNGVFNTPIGFQGNSVEWAIRFVPQYLKNRTQLVDVQFYVDSVYAFGVYKLDVYQGYDTIPEIPVYTDSVTVVQGTEGWISFEISPVAIDTTLPMWIVLSNEGSSYPAVTSTNMQSGMDGRWWNGNGTWEHQSYGAWMIKAVMPLERDAVDEEFIEDAISVYPNPVGSMLYIQGVEEGDAVEIFSMTGSLVANFKYDGAAIDVAGLKAGMYFIRSNGISAKFVKE